MTAEELVKLSLENVKSRHVVFVPGEENQNLMKMIRQSYLKKYLDLKIL